ncbi:MAG: hypothetical protein ACE5JU_08240 [Candidatus Binatia bacterium]
MNRFATAARLCLPVALLAALRLHPVLAAEVRVSPKVGEVVQAIMTEVNKRGRAQAEQNPAAARAANLATINSAEEIPKRIEALQKYRDVVERMIGILRAAPARAVLEAHRRGLEQAAVEEAFKAVDTGIEQAGATVIVKKLQAERRWASAVIESLELLGANRDLWSPEDAPDGTPISIHDRGLAAEFRQAANRIVEAERRANKAADAVNKTRRR